MPSSHSIRAAIAACALGVPAIASAQLVPAPPLPEANATTFTIFLRGAPLGTEQVAVTRTSTGWTISSTGRVSAPLDVVARRLQVRYTSDWRPLDFAFEGTVRGEAQSVHTVVEGTTAKSDVTIGDRTTQRTDAIDGSALLILANSFFGPYEALAARIRTVPAGSDVPVYGEGPMVAFTIRVGASAAEQIQTASRAVSARRTHLTMQFPNVALDADFWIDETGRMVRLSIPVQSVDVVREDVAAVSSRTVTISRPNDERINIPSNGFKDRKSTRLNSSHI